MQRPSIRVAGPVLLLLPVLAVVIALGLIASWQGRRIAERLSDRLMDQAARRIEATVNGYLANAVQVTKRVHLEIASDVLDLDNLESWRLPLYRQVAANDEINSVTFGDRNGAATWVIRYPQETELEYAITQAEIANNIVEYGLGPNGELADKLDSYAFDPRIRPWYDAAVRANAPAWSPPYAWVRGNGRAATLGIAYTRPVLDETGGVAGVLASDISLRDVSRFLSQDRPFASGEAILIGADGKLVGTSFATDVVSPQGERVAASNAVHPVIPNITQAVGPFSSIESSRIVTVRSGETAYRVEVRPFDNPWGLDWRLAVIAPESEVLEGVEQMRRQAWLTGLAVIVLAVGLGVLAAYSIVRPVSSIASAVRRIGEGDLDEPVRVGGYHEFEQLSNELNRMAAGLKDRMRLRHSLSLAMEIQQRLLPSEPPDIPGLEVAGHSTFCDETGGDYFDFIEVSRTDSEELIVVVGDVMGHGIAAALLMATARGILRSRAGEEDSLGKWLTHINGLLVEDTGGERFMTMALLVCDPSTKRVRLASAGHDPPLMYNPAEDRFVELPDISGLPLGLVAEEEYQEAKADITGTGSILLVGTDGLWESPNEEGEAYGKDRIREIMRLNAAGSAKDISAAITANLAKFRGTAKQDDDITFTVVKFTS